MQRYRIEIGGKRYGVEVNEKGGGMYQVVVDGQAFDVRLAGDDAVSSREPVVAKAPEGEAVGSQGGGVESSGGMKTEVRAPMPGVVLSIAVQPGDRVRVAQHLLVLEAMKMKNPISATREGVVSEVMVHEGQSVGYNDVLLRFEGV